MLYLDNQSFCLDLKILWLTFLKVVKRNDISSNGSATIKKIEGTK
jgi:undecaprenyl phosphate N,N'-diacetylbacillosamine 1-phosphate transferase